MGRKTVTNETRNFSSPSAFHCINLGISAAIPLLHPDTRMLRFNQESGRSHWRT
jgi:hypothetical protein